MNRMIRSLAGLLTLAVVPGAAQGLPRAAAGQAQSAQRPGKIETKTLAAIQERRDRLQYALDDEKAAKAAAAEAKARAWRDLASYNAKALSAAELAASLAAEEKFFYDFVVKTTATKLARHDLEQATLFANVRATSVQTLCLIELFKSLAVVREKQLELEYAIADMHAAVAAVYGAQARADRDQTRLKANAINAAELDASLTARNRCVFVYLFKGVAVGTARTNLERAKRSLNPTAPGVER